MATAGSLRTSAPAASGVAIANVGMGGEISIDELAETIVGLCGGRSTIEHAPPRAGEIVRSRARVDRLREQLGVVAQTQLHDGLRQTLA